MFKKKSQMKSHLYINKTKYEKPFTKLGKNSRGIRVSSYDPDDVSNTNQTNASLTQSGQNSTLGCIASKTLGNQRKFMPGGQRVATISQNYNEKSMLLSSDDEYQ